MFQKVRIKRMKKTLLCCSVHNKKRMKVDYITFEMRENQWSTETCFGRSFGQNFGFGFGYGCRNLFRLRKTFATFFRIFRQKNFQKKNSANFLRSRKKLTNLIDNVGFSIKFSRNIRDVCAKRAHPHRVVLFRKSKYEFSKCRSFS